MIAAACVPWPKRSTTSALVKVRDALTRLIAPDGEVDLAPVREEHWQA